MRATPTRHRKIASQSMPKKQPIANGFVLFDVLYEDGTQTSNRRVPAAELGGLDGDLPAKAIVEMQDRKCRAFRAPALSPSPARAKPEGRFPERCREFRNLLLLLTFARRPQ